MAYKLHFGTCEISTGAYTPICSAPIFQLENDAALLRVYFKDGGEDYDITAFTAHVKLFYEATNTETAEVAMAVLSNYCTLSLPTVLTAISGNAKAIVTLKTGDDIFTTCKFPLPIIRTSGTAVTAYEEPAAGTVAYLEGLIAAKQNAITATGPLSGDGAGNITSQPVSGLVPEVILWCFDSWGCVGGWGNGIAYYLADLFPECTNYFLNVGGAGFSTDIEIQFSDMIEMFMSGYVAPSGTTYYTDAACTTPGGTTTKDNYTTWISATERLIYEVGTNRYVKTADCTHVIRSADDLAKITTVFFFSGLNDCSPAHTKTEVEDGILAVKTLINANMPHAELMLFMGEGSCRGDNGGNLKRIVADYADIISRIPGATFYSQIEKRYDLFWADGNHPTNALSILASGSIENVKRGRFPLARDSGMKVTIFTFSGVSTASSAYNVVRCSIRGDAAWCCASVDITAAISDQAWHEIAYATTLYNFAGTALQALAELMVWLRVDGATPYSQPAILTFVAHEKGTCPSGVTYYTNAALTASAGTTGADYPATRINDTYSVIFVNNSERYVSTAQCTASSFVPACIMYLRMLGVVSGSHNYSCQQSLPFMKKAEDA